MICDCFLRPIRKHPTSSSHITGAPLTSANNILVVVLSINPIRRRLDTGSRGVMFYVDSSNTLSANHLRSPQNMSVFVWSVWSCYKSVNFPFSVGTIVARNAGPSENSERGTSCREEKKKKKKEGCIIGYMLVIFLVINPRSLFHAVFGSIMYHPTWKTIPWHFERARFQGDSSLQARSGRPATRAPQRASRLRWFALWIWNCNQGRTTFLPYS